MHTDVEAHNAKQIAYFSGETKRTMRAVDTPYVQRQVDRLILFAGLEPGMRVLDVGCGEGKYTLPLADRGIQVEGLDLTPALLERLHQADAGRHDIVTHCLDICDLPAGQPYDAVVGFMVLHHIVDLVGCFEAIRRVTRPGGPVAFLEPNAYSPAFYVQMVLTPGMTWEGDGGIVRMRRSVVHTAMTDGGLVAPRLERFGAFPPHLTNTPGGARLEDALEHLPMPKLRPFVLFGARAPE